MKTILNTLLLCTSVLCELPPPYYQRGFRPNPELLSQLSSFRPSQSQYGPPKLPSSQTEYIPSRSQSPQTQYGPPRLQSNNVDVSFPSKLTIEQLIRLTEQLHSSQQRIVPKPQTIQLSIHQSSYLSPPREPQREYGPPNNKLDFSQNQLRPPPASNFGSSQPQIVYGAPQQRPQNQYAPPFQTSSTGVANSQFSPHTTYGVPNGPSPSQPGFGSSNNQIRPQVPPSTSYGVPNGPSPSQPGFGSSNNQIRPQVPPSTSYGVPDLRSIETLGELRNQPLNDQDILRQNLLNDFTRQHLPYKEPSGFRPGSQNTEAPSVTQQYLPANGGSSVPQGSVASAPNIPQNSIGIGNQDSSTTRPQNVPAVNQEYLPANNGNQHTQTVQQGSIPQSGTSSGATPNFPQDGHFGSTPVGGNLNNVVQNYLPPQTTTSRAVLATRPTTIRPRAFGTTPATAEGTTNYDYDYDVQQPTLQSTETPTNQDGSASDPNISISNAVAGGGGFFYLQQPDGRLQKVILQKTQEPNGKPEEYIANYYFQNIQALPAVTYTPLVSLGTWK